MKFEKGKERPPPLILGPMVMKFNVRLPTIMVGPRFKKIQSCLLSSRALMGFFNFENSMVFSILQLLNFEISSISMPLKPNKQVKQEEESDIKVVLQREGVPSWKIYHHMEGFSILGLVFATLAFITTEFACNGEIHSGNCLQSDREALIDFKSGLKFSKNRFSSWGGSDCCQWQGIGCEKGTGAVIMIDLHNPEGHKNRNLSGDIRPSLKKLVSLRYLDLSFNSFKDIPIPKFFGSLKNLKYLDLSYAGFSGVIPPNLGNLSNLQYLDLSSEYEQLSVDNFEWVANLVSLKHLQMSEVDLSMVGSQWVEALNKLPFLIELHLPNCGLFDLGSFVRSINFTSLAILNIRGNNFNSTFPGWLVNISSLKSIDISSSDLSGRIPLGIGELPNLQYLDLSWNRNLSCNCLHLLRGSWKKIEILDLASNLLHGTIPNSFGNLCKLRYLNVEGNNLTGSLPEFLEEIKNCSSKRLLPNLKNLILPRNHLIGNLPEWLGKLENLEELILDDNKLQGPIPASLGRLSQLVELGLENNKLQGLIPASLGNLHHLKEMRLDGNNLNGSLPDSFGQLSELVTLDVSFNGLMGTLSEKHFSKLSKLKNLYLDSNSFILSVSSNWTPPFQIFALGMRSCNLGNSFPVWLQSQKEVAYLDFSNASISGSLPNWFWNISFNMWVLNISLNQIQGQLPSLLNVAEFGSIDLSSNQFEGPIPLPNPVVASVDVFDLSNNKFSGSIPLNIGDSIQAILFLSLSGNQITGTIPASIGFMWRVNAIDLSRNRLAGSIPSTIGNCLRLLVLNLGYNNLSGMIPKSLGQLEWLQSLHLDHNNLSGALPASFQNLSSLETLDLGSNKLSGNIPRWIGTAFMNLRILKLRSNEFSGRLPSKFSNLSSLHVLDLAENNLTGSIPSTLSDLKAMAREGNVNKYLFYAMSADTAGKYYEESSDVSTKGQVLNYTKTLSLVVSIDLSSNNLSGEFPKEITALFGLVMLNLSRNHITGHIPENISRLHQLSSLDLSSNMFFGVIPGSMSSLSALGYLNLSYNNFSGVIPFIGQMTTFNASVFDGNPGLCGAPLDTKCQGEGLDGGQKNVVDEKGNGYLDEWFYLSVGLGFAVGVLLPFFICTFSKSCYEVYFGFVNKIVGKLVWLKRRANRS